jgi:hypothetical protein
MALPSLLATTSVSSWHQPLVLDAAGDRGDAAGFEHAAFLVDAEFHPALDHPHELLVWMRMGSHMRSGHCDFTRYNGRAQFVQSRRQQKLLSQTADK